MFGWIRGFRPPQPAYRPIVPAQTRRVVFGAACRDALRDGLAPEIGSRHEGIVYLLGQTDGFTSVVVSVFRPNARTTKGSFRVEVTAMRHVVEAASANGLQVVGQLHTHPGHAFHSDGDEEGAHIRFNGFVSIVLPDYGTRLPGFDGAAIYMFGTAERRFVQLSVADLCVLPARMP
jgi:proteasome lid subunit RPN8/RPN11